MKSKALFTLAICTLLQLGSFAQSKKNHYPITTEEGISHITVASNIDILLIQSADDKVNVRVKPENLDKLKVVLHGTSLFLDTKANSNERIEVFVTVDELKGLRLNGNSYAVSHGILESGLLKVDLDETSRVAIRTNGKIRVNAPKKQTLIEESKSSAVYSFASGEAELLHHF
ncbi:MAG: DUF2807 domain-containing protein [Gemmatimonadaceae bacterium]|nr:DUF2807 domain-containing protein [Chitinophagaceae bacterium]